MKGLRHTTRGVRLAALPMPGREIRVREQGEAGFQRTLIAFLRLMGWKVAHFAPARVLRNGVEKYETPVRADGRGFLDLVCVRERVVYVECKAESGRLTPDQRLWHNALVAAGAEVYVWKPSDWVAIEKVMGR